MRLLLSFSIKRIFIVLTAALVSFVFLPESFAQIGGTEQKDPIDLELEYADGLMKMRLPDYAKIVLGRLNPDVVGPRMKVLQLRSYIAVGDFKTIIALIKKEPNQRGKEVWAMKLALADGYYAWGKYAEAKSLYASFFRQYPAGPSKGLESFFLESAYKYAQMLILMGDDEGAVFAYEKALLSTPKKDGDKRHVRRQLLGETMELLIKVAEKNPAKVGACNAKIKDILNEILWIQDLWFGKAVVVMAHQRKLAGDLEGARALIKEYTKQLEEIDKFLREEEKKYGGNMTKLSPVAECLYLLGLMLQEEAEKAHQAKDRATAIKLLAGEKTGSGRTPGALHHFVKVFVKYPYTGWAPEAGKRARSVQEMLEEYGLKININIDPSKWEAVRKAQFMQARALFGQQRFLESAEQYVDILNLFPEGESSVAALGDLVRCYMETGDEIYDIYADMVLHYLAERFCRNKKLQIKAGDTLTKLAGEYAERGRRDKEQELNKIFFERFEDHPRVPAMVYNFGKEAFEKKDFNSALGYFTRITEKHKDARVYEIALNRVAKCYGELKNVPEQTKALEALIDVLEKKQRPGQPFIAAKLQMITTHRILAQKHHQTKPRTEETQKLFNKELNFATKEYIKLGKLLAKQDETASIYQSSPEDKKRNDDVLEACLYYQARGFSMLTAPTNHVPAFKKAAVKRFENFVEKYPKSTRTPSALSQVGTLYTLLGDMNKAQEALSKLQKDYKDSPVAKNVLYMMGNNLLKLGMRKKAIEIFKQMFSDTGGKYSDTQILNAGLQLVDAEEYEIALEALNKVLVKSKSRAIHQRALMGKGKVLCELGQYQEGAKALGEWLEKYPKSKGLVDVAFYASRAYAELAKEETDPDKRFDLFNKAVLAMKKVRAFDRTPAGRAKSDVGIARIHLLRSHAEAKHGTAEKAKAAKGEAFATLQSLIFFVNINKPGVKPHLEDAYFLMIPALLEEKKWGDALENCDGYLSAFAVGAKYLREVRKWRVTANMKVKVSGALGGNKIDTSDAKTSGQNPTDDEEVTQDMIQGDPAPAEKPEPETAPSPKKAE